MPDIQYRVLVDWRLGSTSMLLVDAGTLSVLVVDNDRWHEEKWDGRIEEVYAAWRAGKLRETPVLLCIEASKFAAMGRLTMAAEHYKILSQTFPSRR